MNLLSLKWNGREVGLHGVWLLAASMPQGLKAAAACVLLPGRSCTQALQHASCKHMVSLDAVLLAQSTQSTQSTHRRRLNRMRHKPARFDNESVTRTSAASAGGYPYTPVLMAGNARFSSFRLLARSRQLLQEETAAPTMLTGAADVDACAGAEIAVSDSLHRNIHAHALHAGGLASSIVASGRMGYTCG